MEIYDLLDNLHDFSEIASRNTNRKTVVIIIWTMYFFKRIYLFRRNGWITEVHCFIKIHDHLCTNHTSSAQRGCARGAVQCQQGEEVQGRATTNQLIPHKIEIKQIKQNPWLKIQWTKLYTAPSKNIEMITTLLEKIIFKIKVKLNDLREDWNIGTWKHGNSKGCQCYSSYSTKNSYMYIVKQDTTMWTRMCTNANKDKIIICYCFYN